MILNRRERTIAYLAFGALALMGVDHFLVTPYQNKKARLETEKMQALAEIQRGRSILARWREISAGRQDKWPAELMTEPGGGTILVLNALRDWADESRLTLTLLRPEGSTRHEQWEETVFQVVAAGSMKSVVAFLWRVENTELPLKIKDLQLSARREGSDDLALQVRIGGLAPNPEPSPVPRRAAGAAPDDEEESL